MTREQTGPGDVKLQEWQEGGLFRESWVRLGKLACLEERDVGRRLGHLANGDGMRIAQARTSLFNRLSR